MLGASLGLAVVLVLHADPAPAEAVEEEIPVHRDPIRFDIGAKVDLRSGQPEGIPSNSLTDVEVDPYLAVRIPFHAGSLTLAYEPRLFLVLQEYPPPQAGQDAERVAYLNRARLLLDLAPGPRWRIYVEGRFAYGKNDFLPLSTVITPTTGTGAPPNTPGTTPTAPTPAPGQSTLPDTRFLPIIGIDASLGLVYSLSTRLGWRLAGGYTYSGGADVSVRTTLPLQKGPHGQTGIDWSASREDTLTILLDASNLRFSSGPQSTIVTLTTGWTHAWDHNLGTDLLLGIGGIHALTPPTPGIPGVHNAAYPVGGVGIRYTWGTRAFVWDNGLTFLAAPSPDRLSGAVNERLSLALRSSFSPIKQLVFDVTGVGSRAIDADQRDTRLETKATYLLGPQFGVSLGARLAWLEGSTLLGPQGFGWLAFISVGTSGGTNLFGDSK
jgi:hypothetical protein